MRIVHTCLRYPPATGGVETYVKEIVEGTRNIDEHRDVRVLTSKMKTHGPITELDPRQLLDDPMYVQRLHHTQTPFISYPRLQALQYYIGHHDPDIVHGHSFWYQTADGAAQYARKQNIPFVFNPFYYTNQIRHKATWQLYQNTVGRKTFSTADCVVVISPYEQDCITKSRLPVKKFELVPPGINKAVLQRPQPNPFEPRSISGTILLTVSRIAAGKGLDEIIQILPDIIAKAPDTHLVIVGEDFGEQKKLQNQLEQLKLAHYVHFLGKLPYHELIGAYQHADIFVHPSHFEAFGIVLAEASAAGLPIVARNDFAIPYVAPHEKSGLLFKTTSELYESIMTLIKNQNLRQTYGQQGQEYSTTQFSWKKTSSKMISIYDQLLTL